MSKWISVKKRLPKIRKKYDGASEDVLICVEDNRIPKASRSIRRRTIYTGYLADGYWWLFNGNDSLALRRINSKPNAIEKDIVTYWHKIPKMPKGDE